MAGAKAKAKGRAKGKAKARRRKSNATSNDGQEDDSPDEPPEPPPVPPPPEPPQPELPLPPEAVADSVDEPQLEPVPAHNGDGAMVVDSHVEVEMENENEDVHMDDIPQSASSSKPSHVTVVPVERAERVHRTPQDIMQMLLPNKDFMISIKFNDWRFDSSCKLQLSATHMKKLYAPYSQKTLSRSFASRLSWEDALAEVHDFTWRKWKLLMDVSPLTLETGEQRPGCVPQEVLDLLKPVIENMDAPTTYPKKSK